MSSNHNKKDREYQRTRRKKVFLILIYPFTLAMIAAGFAAFFLLVMGFSAHLAATVALGFFGFTSTIVYFVSKAAIEQTNFKMVFLNIFLFADMFALISLLSYLYSYFG